MPLVNLTPHPVAIYGPERTIADGPEEVIPPSGTVARVAVIELGTSLSPQSGRRCELVEYGHEDARHNREIDAFLSQIAYMMGVERGYGT